MPGLAREGKPDGIWARSPRDDSARIMDRTTLGSVALMFVAMSLIPLGDSAGKILTTQYGATPLFVAFARFAVGAAMVARLPFAP